jgi:plasmid maintenance system antidote protein VapI
MNQPLKKKYDEFLSEDNVEVLRQRLISIMDHYGFKLTRVARLLDISAQTLDKFISDKGVMSFPTMMKIDDYVREMELNIKESFK